MNKKKPIIVWKNGKQEKIRRLDDGTHVTFIKRSLTFIARFFTRGNRKRNPFKKRIKIKDYKPVIIAFVSAIFIGLILGFIMLHMMKNVNGDSPGTSPASNEIVNNNGIINSDTNDSMSSSEEALDEMSAFVIQAGLFSDKTNADEWSKSFQQAGLQPIIWEREQQYFLFIGLTNTIEEAKQLLIELEPLGFDIFIKEWSTSELKVDMTSEEHTWLQTFQSEWLKTLQSISEPEKLFINDWQGLIDNQPLNNKRISVLGEVITAYHKLEDGELLNDIDLQHMLLTMWNEYEKLLK